MIKEHNKRKQMETINMFLRGCSDHQDQLFCLFELKKLPWLHKNTSQCKIFIVPEEGWFGQPKYSTPSKNHPTLCRFLLLYSSFYM